MTSSKDYDSGPKLIGLISKAMRKQAGLYQNNFYCCLKIIAPQTGFKPMTSQH